MSRFILGYAKDGIFKSDLDISSTRSTKMNNEVTSVVDPMNQYNCRFVKNTEEDIHFQRRHRIEK